MSGGNIALVQSLYAAFGRGDITTIIGALSPDVEWVCNGQRSAYPTFGTWKGPAEVQKFFKLVADLEAFTEFSPQDFHAVGELVFVAGRYAGSVKKSGRSFACDWLHVFAIKGGKVAQFREFTDTAQFADAYRS
jgi:ketosteroid isomerase-like protein